MQRRLRIEENGAQGVLAGHRVVRVWVEHEVAPMQPPVVNDMADETLSEHVEAEALLPVVGGAQVAIGLALVGSHVVAVGMERLG